MAAGVISDADALGVALRFKALGDPVRVKLLSLLLAGDRTGLRNTDLAATVGLSDATISHHLAQLHRAGLVAKSPQGRNVYYRVERAALGALVKVVDPDCC